MGVILTALGTIVELQKVPGEVGDDTVQETLALSILQVSDRAWGGVGTERQTGSRVRSRSQQGCEVPWV